MSQRVVTRRAWLRLRMIDLAARLPLIGDWLRCRFECGTFTANNGHVYAVASCWRDDCAGRKYRPACHN